MLKVICLVAALVSLAGGRGYQNDLISLTAESFDQITADQNIFVCFIYDFQNHEKFIELVKEIKNVANEADDLDSRMLKFGIFDCKKNVKKCREEGLSRSVEVRFYGKENKWPELSDFFDQMVEEVNQEDTLLELLEKPGRFLILFKVVYCPYCKDTLEEWMGVKKYFENSSYVRVFTLDCTRRRPICHRFDVKKFPKIKFIYNPKTPDKQTVFTFEGDRTTKEINKFAVEMLHATMK